MILFEREGGDKIKVYRVEQHTIKKSHKAWETIDELCFKSKNLYNYANYTIRQEFINNGEYIKFYDMCKILKTSEPYRELGSNIGQAILRLLDKNWKSFFVANKDYKKNPHKYLGKPRIPKYKDKNGRNIFILDSNKVHLKDGYIYFSWKPMKQFNNLFKTKIPIKPKEIRFIPRGFNYIMEVVYEVEVSSEVLESKNIIGIDLGVNNFVTIGNNIGIKPIVVNGGAIKSMNQYYNKKQAEMRKELKLNNGLNWSKRLDKLNNKRYNKISNYMHKVSRLIINYCTDNNIDTIIVGYNKTWKQDINIGKVNNQNFVYIPYYKFIKMLKYKCESENINFIVVKEHYTSGTSFLDNELPIEENYNIKRRVKRGLFKSSNGTLINADLNASYQIIKKVFPNALNGIEGVDLHPIKLNVY